MDAEKRASRWRRRAAAMAVTCAGAAVWAGLAFGAGAGGVAKGGGAAPHATKAAKKAHVVRARTMMHDGNCPNMGADAGAQV